MFIFSFSFFLVFAFFYCGSVCSQALPAKKRVALHLLIILHVTKARRRPGDEAKLCNALVAPCVLQTSVRK